MSSACGALAENVQRLKSNTDPFRMCALVRVPLPYMGPQVKPELGRANRSPEDAKNLTRSVFDWGRMTPFVPM